MKNSINIINRKVKFEYEVIETYIAGIVLLGSEVRSIKLGKVSLVDTFCFFNNKELFVKNINIPSDGTAFSHNPMRDKKLLLNKKELKKLGESLINGLNIIPYRLFRSSNGLIKVEIILGKSKKIYDKRSAIKKRDIDRELRNI